MCENIRALPLALLIAAALLAASLSVGQEMEFFDIESLKVEGGLRRSDVEEIRTLSALVDGQIEARRILALRLIVIGEDTTRDGEERIAALLLLRKACSQEGIQYCCDNVSLNIVKTVRVADDDGLKGWPCYYVLKSMGWRIVPYVLESLRQERDPQDVRLLALLLKEVCGQPVAEAVIKTKLEQLADDPEGETARKNLRDVLAHVSTSDEKPED